jgi:hypothetical protein
MKTFKAICAASVLALSLSIPAYADDPPPSKPGDGHESGIVNPIGGIPTPPTPPPAPGAAGGTAPVANTFTILDLFMALAKIF